MIIFKNKKAYVVFSFAVFSDDKNALFMRYSND